MLDLMQRFLTDINENSKNAVYLPQKMKNMSGIVCDIQKINSKTVGM